MTVPDYTLPLAELPDPLPVVPVSRAFDVSIVPPGSKSLTNRAYIVAALADGDSTVRRPLRADDTDRLLAGLCTLGVGAEWDGDDVRIRGVGGRFPSGGRVDLGDGGTPARFMIAAACLAREPVVIDGSPRMRERPVAEGVQMLRGLGAKIEYVESEGRLPLRTLPSPAFRGGTLHIAPQQSSQFASALLLVAPNLDGGIELHLERPVTSESYFNMTVAFLAAVGARAVSMTRRGRNGGTEVIGRVDAARVAGFDHAVEPDASSATYWLAAAATGPRGSTVDVEGLGAASVQPDAAFRSVLADMGAEWDPPDGRTSTIRRGCAALTGIDVDMALMPDAALTLAAISALAGGPSRITGLHTLPTKECDRIAALATNLRRIGCTVEASTDSLAIDPATRHDRPVTIETYNDHRMAMAFAALGLARPGLAIANPACVAKSYPGFWRDLDRLRAAAGTSP